MNHQYVSEKDVDVTPKTYIKYLRDTFNNAKGNLALPEQQWPRGSSHDISRAIMEECEDLYFDTVLEYGLFSAYGKLIDFQE